MTKKTEVVLRNAIRQIKTGKGGKARPELVALLRREPENSQAWYLLSFALDDPQRQQYSLLQALRIKPDFEKAHTRLSKIRDETTTSAVTAPKVTASLKEPELIAPETTVPAFLDQKEETPPQDAFSFDDTETNSESNTQKPRLKVLPIFLGILVIGLLIFAAWLFMPNLAGPAPTATPVASRTLPPTWTPTAIPPSATSTNTPIPTSTPTLEISPTVEGEVSPTP